MRLLAKHMGCSLSEHALHVDVIRNHFGEKISEGRRVHMNSEAAIFARLGLQYLRPEDRNQ